MTVTDHVKGNPSADTRPRDRDIRRIAGCLIADGQLRLLIFHGGRQHLQFWQAADTSTGRQLALTLVDPDGVLPAQDVDEILCRTVRLRGIDVRGVAKVLEVARTARGGVVVSEWVRGASLREVANTAPSPIGAARAIRALAEVAEAAHQAGLALSIDDPSRIRISTEGNAVLAFPATMPDATAQTDLVGIGGALYGLLVNRWPLPVELNAEGRPEEPAALNPQIPFLVSATADGLMRGPDGIRSATTALALLDQAIDEADNPVTPGHVRQPPSLPPSGCYAGFRNFGPIERAEAARGQMIKACLGTAAAIIVVLVIILASTLNRILDSGNTDVASTAEKLGLQTSSPAAPVPEPRPIASAHPVKPVSAAVFSPGGSADSPNSARLAIDGDPSTAWSTDTYFDAAPFPTFKPGVGLLLQLPTPTVLSSVAVDLNSTGTVVQIRASASAVPAKLDDTTELSAPTPLQSGHNNLPVTNPARVPYLLVWISTLGTTEGKSHADISEITLQGP